MRFDLFLALQADRVRQSLTQPYQKVRPVLRSKTYAARVDGSEIPPPRRVSSGIPVCARQSLTGYTRGCRCVGCVEANSIYRHGWWKRTHAGIAPSGVEA